VGGRWRPELRDRIAENFVGVGRLGVRTVALAFPIVLGRAGNTITVVTKADLLRPLQEIESLLDLGKARIGINGGVQAGRDVLRGAMEGGHELEQADGFGDFFGKGVCHFLGDTGNLAAQLAGDVPRDEVVDLVDACKCAHWQLTESNVPMNEQLLGELDDGAVGAADVATCAALGAQARNDVDDQLNLVRQERVKGDEGISSEVGQAVIGADGGALGQASTVGFELLAEEPLAFCILGQDAAAGYFGNIGWLQVNLERKAVHEAGEFDALVVKAADKLGELLL